MPRLPRPIYHAVCAVAVALLVGGAAAGLSDAAAAGAGGAGVGVTSDGASLARATETPQPSQQIGTLSATLGSQRAEASQLSEQVNVTHSRLLQLEASAADAERVLAAQVVGNYESARPDLGTVVLQSTGVEDLLQRLALARRVGSRNLHEADQVRATRAAVAAEATQFGSLQERQRALASAILEQQSALARARVSLIQQQLAAIQGRRRAITAQLQSRAAGLQSQLSALQAEAATRGGSPAAESPSPTFPLPKPAAAPLTTWSLADGVDISAAATAPEYAVCSGTIVLHGIGGFGPWAPVLRCDSSLDGHRYLYYGASGPGGQVAVGTRVESGQVIGSVGPGLVGISTGPHLELGFADASGNPIGGRSASRMLALLEGLYRR